MCSQSTDTSINQSNNKMLFSHCSGAETVLRTRKKHIIDIEHWISLNNNRTVNHGEHLCPPFQIVTDAAPPPDFCPGICWSIMTK